MLLHQKKNHYLRIGLAITAVITAMALVGCFWTPYAPTAMSGSEKFAAPSLRHLFGTDNFGRDIFSRVMVGARTTFFISACTVTIGAVVGTLVHYQWESTMNLIIRPRKIKKCTKLLNVPGNFSASIN